MKNAWECTQDRDKISNEVKIQTLQDMVNVLKQEIGSLTDANKDLHKQIQKMSIDAKTQNQVHSENEALQFKITQLNQEIESKTQNREYELKIFKEQINELRHELKILRESSDINSKQQIVDLKQEIVDLKQIITQKDEALQQMEGKVDEIQVG